MATAKKLPSGSWRVRVFSHYEIKDGRKIRKYESFTSKQGKREAERLAAEWLWGRERRIQDDTVYQTVNDYIETRSGVLSPSTRTAYLSYLKEHIEEIGALSIRDLPQEKIQLWVSRMAMRLSPKSVANICGLLQAAYLDKTGRNLRITLPQKKKPLLHTPTDDEVKKLLDHVKGKELEIAIMLAAFCSLRRGEICALDYSDFKDGMVWVTKSMVRSGTIWEAKPPKTPDSIRCVPVPDKLQELIDGKKGPVVTCSPDNLSNRFRRAIKFSKVTPFRFHDLRHYYASMAHYLGVPDAYVMANGGWKTDQVMKRVYREAMQDKRKAENDKIAQHINDMMT